MKRREEIVEKDLLTMQLGGGEFMFSFCATLDQHVHACCSDLRFVDVKFANHRIARNTLNIHALNFRISKHHSLAPTSFSACSRRCRFKILPLAVLGISDWNLMPPVSRLYEASFELTCLCTSSSVSLSPSGPGRFTM